MTEKNKSFGIPAGLRDYLPEEAELKRSLEGKWEKIFSTWGYQEVITPTFEYYKTLITTLGSEDSKLHKVIDREGHILAMRPDMTNPIARLAATRYKKEPLPLRFFYLGNVFRYETDLQKGRQREFYQAGVELLGAKNSWADAEVIALALEALEAAGLEDYKIGVGHVGITNELIKILCDEDIGQEKLRQALSRKNMVEIDNLITYYAGETDVKELITGQWKNGEIIKRLKGVVADEVTLQAIVDLEEILGVLKNLGLSEKVFIDLSILRDFNYYTGIVFEGYSSKLGYPLLGGGRYDNLLSNFGYDCSATGFALGVERVMSAIPLQNAGRGTDYFVTGSGYSRLFSEARKLREEGYKVEIDLLSRSKEEAEEYAKSKRISNVISLAGDGDE